MSLEAHDVALVVGKRGSGKSHHAKALVGGLLSRARRVVAFDPHDEYSRMGRKSSAVTLGPLAKRVTVSELLESPELLDAPKLSLAVVPDSMRCAELAADFCELVDLVLATGDLCLVADEVGEYEAEAYDALNTLATQSRHAAVPCVLVAQRLTQIPKTARTQASVVVTFLQSNPEDLEALVKLTGDKDFAARVSRLPRRKFLEWRDNQEDEKS